MTKQKTNNIVLYLIAALLFYSFKGIAAIRFIAPLEGTITSGYGFRINPITNKKEFHKGLDIAGNIGDIIVAPMAGQVAKIFKNDKGGLQMIIKHSPTLWTGYAHLSNTIAKVTDIVQQGDKIANVGITGTTTGPHLHFTVFDNTGKYINPQNFLL